MTWTTRAASSAPALRDRWDARDERYTVRRMLGVLHPLSPTEAALVDAWRRAEAETLPEPDRSAALAILGAWRAPGRRAAT